MLSSTQHVHPDLQPELEAQLAAKAQARGLPLPRNIEKLVTARSLESATAEDHQRLLDLAALADPEEGHRQGLEDIAAGRTRPAREVFAELREEYGIRG